MFYNYNIDSQALCGLVFKKYLKKHQECIEDKTLDINEKLLLTLLDNNGYIISYYKFSPKFIKFLTDQNIKFFAFKYYGGAYFILLKKYQKQNPDKSFLFLLCT